MAPFGSEIWPATDPLILVLSVHTTRPPSAGAVIISSNNSIFLDGRDRSGK